MLTATRGPHDIRPDFQISRPKNVDDTLVPGTIRVFTLSYFRKLEGLEWIADANEATTTVVNIGGAVITSESEEPQFETWGPPGFTKLFSAKTGGKSHLELTPGSLMFIPIVFFCASQGERGKLIQSMCRDAKQTAVELCHSSRFSFRFPNVSVRDELMTRST
jgi:hypothetical protein